MDQLRFCPYCKKDHPATSTFFPMRNGRLGRKCRVCYNRHRRGTRFQSYAARAKHNQRLIDHVADRKDRINKYKSETPCSDCGGMFNPWQMQFDHIHGNKRENISRMVNRATSLPRLIAELDKCELVCANCHANRTHDRGYKTSIRERV